MSHYKYDILAALTARREHRKTMEARGQGEVKGHSASRCDITDAFMDTEVLKPCRIRDRQGEKRGQNKGRTILGKKKKVGRIRKGMQEVLKGT